MSRKESRFVSYTKARGGKRGTCRLSAPSIDKRFQVSGLDKNEQSRTDRGDFHAPGYLGNWEGETHLQKINSRSRRSIGLREVYFLATGAGMP